MKKTLSLVGIGMGNKNLLTSDAETALKNAEIIFGAKRILESVTKILNSGDSGENSQNFRQIYMEELYKASEIAEFLKNHPSYERAVVCFSGDTGFYSGAAAFFENFSNEWSLEIKSGIASPVYFAAKLHKSWQNWKMLSLHGAKCNTVEQIRKNPACFFILSGAEDVKSVGKKLETALKNGVLSQIRCFLGSNLSYDVEKIIQIEPKEMMNFQNFAEKVCYSRLISESLGDMQQKSLFVLLVENENPEQSDLPVLRDEDFLREPKIPMTKQEIRGLSICALGLSKSSIVYDVGSGSGSVTVEVARIATEGQVFAIDSDEDAMSLTQKNAEKFCLENVTFLHGTAPEILENTQNLQIPAPTHVFIGGSKGNLGKIVRFALQKNPKVKIVANFVSLENLCEMQNLVKSLEEEFCEKSGGVSGGRRAEVACKNDPAFDFEIKQIAVTRGEKAGDFHLMKAQNPVWICRISRR